MVQAFNVWKNKKAVKTRMFPQLSSKLFPVEKICNVILADMIYYNSFKPITTCVFIPCLFLLTSDIVL